SSAALFVPFVSPPIRRPARLRMFHSRFSSSAHALRSLGRCASLTASVSTTTYPHPTRLRADALRRGRPPRKVEVGTVVQLNRSWSSAQRARREILLYALQPAQGGGANCGFN